MVDEICRLVNFKVFWMSTGRLGPETEILLFPCLLLFLGKIVVLMCGLWAVLYLQHSSQNINISLNKNTIHIQNTLAGTFHDHHIFRQ